MSTTIDNFTKQLHDNLEAVEDRAKSLKESLQSATKNTQAELQAKLDEAKTKLEAKKEQFDEYRLKLKTQFEEKESEVKSNVEEWKAEREVKKLEHRADKAEDYAATAIFLAMAMMEEAEEATLAAICTRLDATTAANTTEKQDLIKPNRVAQ
jgi:tellurite resistance protein